MMLRIKSVFRLIGLGFSSLAHNGIKETFKAVVFFFKIKLGKKPLEYSDPEKEAALITPEEAYRRFIEDIEYCDGKIFLQEILEGFATNGKPTVAVVSHELNLTGAPWAVYYMALEIQKQGKNVVFMSPRDGGLRNEITNMNIPSIILPSVYDLPVVDRNVGLFSFIVLSTNVAGPLAKRLSCLSVPVLWWIHEADFNYHQAALDRIPERIGNNIHVYCGGEYARAVLAKYRPNFRSESLLYLTPDFSLDDEEQSDFVLLDSEGKTIFTIVGTMEERKDQGLIIDAIEMIPETDLEHMVFVFVGTFHYDPIEVALKKSLKRHPVSVRYYKELSHVRLMQLYKLSHCLICASKDDPMPIVVTEAMIMEKIIICSTNTGSAPLLEQRHAGLVFPSGDVNALFNSIKSVCENKDSDEFKIMTSNARKTYEEFFSKEAFVENINRVCSELTLNSSPVIPYEWTVSVAIPSFNAGDDFKELLPLLKKQKNIGSVEIVVVDSGSNDGSAEYAESEGAKVIRISQSEFSHSFARNLAASNSTGEYILFMTQDAKPDGYNWIAGLIKPILLNDVVAVSCLEQPRPECDLLGRVSSWAHSDYMGVLYQDRIMEMPNSKDYNSIRKNGQLNDVTCLVKKDVFMKFNYRGDYAEDLDLGIRLINAGYKTALLSSVKVIHSHTRPSFYHFKRAQVDTFTLKKILPDMPVMSVTDQQVADMAVTGWCVTSFVIERLMNCDDIKGDIFFDRVNKYFNEAMSAVKGMQKEEIKAIIDKSSCDENMRNVIVELFNGYSTKYSYNNSIVLNEQSFAVTLVPRYMAYADESFDYKTISEVRDLILKLVGLHTGIMFANYRNSHDEDSLLTELINKYSKGV